jgi:hypothetical protein
MSSFRDRCAANLLVPAFPWDIGSGGRALRGCALAPSAQLRGKGRPVRGIDGRVIEEKVRARPKVDSSAADIRTIVR